MKPDNRNIVEKVDLAVSDLQDNGGYLNPMQANTFIRMLIEQPTIVNDIRVVSMNSPVMEINKIGFGQRILRVAPASGSALDSGERASPTTDKVELFTKEVMAEIHIPYDVLEDNIERGALEDTIMALIAERASLDIEELAIQGVYDVSPSNVLELMDGILELSHSHRVEYLTPTEITKAVFKAGIKAMPNVYMRNRAAMKFYVSPQAEIEWQDSIANRLTTLGDGRVIGWQPTPAYGIPVVPAALMPDENYLLTYPKNIILGVQRQIMIETDRDIRTRVLIVVLTMRLALQFEEEQAVVVCSGLNPHGITTTS